MMRNKKSKNLSRVWAVVAFVFVLVLFGGLVINSASAQGLVPCGNGNDPTERCTLCHLVLGIKNIIDWGFVILVALALVMVVVGGVIYIVSTGDQTMIGTAKGILKNTLFGFAFVLLAWLLVNFTIYLLGANVGIDRTDRTWNDFTCESTPSTM